MNAALLVSILPLGDLMNLLSGFLFFIQMGSADPVTHIDQAHISPICSTVLAQVTNERISLPNTHLVLAKNAAGAPVYRSNSPYKTQHVLDIISLNVQKVVVYKNFYDTADKEELYSLYQDSGFDSSNLIHIAMPWKRDGKKPFDYKAACEMTVDAINVLQYSKKPSLFHCTVGEDRTGMLAGVLQVLNGMDIEKAFRDEMCAHGYEAGNPKKSLSPSVVESVREVLTPLYLKMATVIALNGKIKKSDCASLPTTYTDSLRASDLVCESVRDEFLCASDSEVIEESVSDGLGLGLAPAKPKTDRIFFEF